jgi:hypothetical protein
MRGGPAVSLGPSTGSEFGTPIELGMKQPDSMLAIKHSKSKRRGMDIIEAISRFMDSGMDWAHQVPWLKPEFRLAQVVKRTPQAAAQGVVQDPPEVVMFFSDEVEMIWV